MLGYVAGAFALGAFKSLVLRPKGGKTTAHAVLGLGADVLAEELLYRTGLERAVGRGALQLAPEPARVASAALFGLGHANPLDAALGGYLYSRAYDVGGLPLAAAAHLAHNLGVLLLAK